jgi:hypothetical protein
MRTRRRKLLVAAIGAATLTIGCKHVFANPKAPPVDAKVDGHPPDSQGVEAGAAVEPEPK